MTEIQSSCRYKVSPEYRLLDDAELLLTIFAANP